MKDVCSHTTRPPRKSEITGREHWFDTQDEFDELMRTGDICAYAKLEDTETGKKGYEYCSTLDDVLNADLYVLDPNGLSDMLSRHPELHTFVLYVHASKEVRKQRALLRDTSQEVVFETRYANEHKQFDEFFRNGKYDTAIINEGISESALCATVRDVKFYLVDLETEIIYDYKNSLLQDEDSISGAYNCAVNRFLRSNSDNLLEINYRLHDFILENSWIMKD